jgi:hypothetical protein
MPLIHYLIIYDHSTQSLVGEPQEFTDPDEAARAYARAELFRTAFV